MMPKRFFLSVVAAVLLFYTLAPAGNALPAQSAAALPMPTFHHIHLNSVNPEASLDWYAQFWPRGERTTYGGFPAFHDEIYLLYTKVPKQAPGAFDPKLQRAVPQSAFWTFGSTFTDTVAMYARLSKLDPKRFQFLPVYIGPDDNVGVHRSAARAVRRSDSDAHPAA